MQSRLQQYIDGQWVDSEGGRTHQVINPATEQPVTEVTLGSAADVDKAVAAARRAFDTFSQTSVAERAQLLERTIEAYKARIPDLAKAVSEEMGAPIGFAQAAQVPAGLGYFMSTLKALGEFQWEERIGKARVVHEPIGVVAMITPWNWPLNQICAKVAPALAAGDTMILKPSEECPSCAMILAEILDAAGVPAGVFNLINGDGPGVGAALSGHRGVDMVSFTGSTRAGIAVAQAAAPTVKRVHQELGGKAPNLVLEGADLAQVLPPTVQGVLANTGQSCIAPTRILVHKDQLEQATEVVRQIMQAAPVGDPAEMGAHIGPVVNRAQFDKIQELIQSAIDEGATLEQAIQLANDTDYGLSATISGDPAKASEVASKLRAGLVSINSWTGGNGTPFGGYKQSGNGREGGKFGIADFLEVKTIIGEAA
jgi:aldehyde dehydrogenase (NAD+)